MTAIITGTSRNGADDLPFEDMTRDELIDMIRALGEGGIKIYFDGKANARSLARRVRPRVTRTLSRYSVGSHEEQAKNLVMEGDNLQAMATLYREHGQVDLIVADPPYNTGKDFRYNDKWEEDPNDTGLGEFVSKDDVARHTKWMRFMWPRIQMMYKMLKLGGVLAICIDHRELFRLGQMLDERFGEANRLAIINWQKSYSPKSGNHVSTATEYVLVYAKDTNKAKTALLDRTAEMDARYKNPDNDPDGLWKSGDLSAPPHDKPEDYGIQSPFTGEIHYPSGMRRWGLNKTDIKKHLEAWGVQYVSMPDPDATLPSLVLKGTVRKAGRLSTPEPILAEARERALAVRAKPAWPLVYFSDDRARNPSAGGPAMKVYWKTVKKGSVPMTYWADEDYDVAEELGSTSWEHEESGHSQTGINEIDNILGKGHGFETVKPLRLIQKVIHLWCPGNGLVLDPFAGSGTTGHAVLSLNAMMGSERRFILVEQGRPERGDSYARTLTHERLRRAIAGEWDNGKGTPIGGGFRFVTLGKKVDAKALLQMERSEMVDTVIASHFDANRRRGTGLVYMVEESYRYLVARNGDNEGFFLVWDGPDKNTDFTEDAYEACSKEAKRAGLKPLYHVYARLYLYQTSNVRFYQIPDRILVDFGLDIRGDRFEEDEE